MDKQLARFTLLVVAYLVLVASGFFAIIYGIHMTRVEIKAQARPPASKQEILTLKSEMVRLRARVKEIDALRADLKAYESKVNDLSQAYIRHHGEYPRTQRR